jgi:Tn3 transposase DDE domain
MFRQYVALLANVIVWRLKGTNGLPVASLFRSGLRTFCTFRTLAVLFDPMKWRFAYCRGLLYHRPPEASVDWISDPDLRCETWQELNKGQVRNSLARAVFIQRLGEIRGRGRHEPPQSRMTFLLPIRGNGVDLRCPEPCQRTWGPEDHAASPMWFCNLSPLGPLPLRYV